MAELLSYAETQKLLDELDKAHQKLVADMVPSQISVGGIQRVLQNLLAERISIRDLPTILEGISEACGYSRNISVITEHVRARLARQISDANTNESGFIPLVSLSPQWEQAFAEALDRPGRGPASQHGAVASCRNSSPAVRGNLRAPRHAGRDAGAADQPGDPALCALDHRALPRP